MRYVGAHRAPRPLLRRPVAAGALLATTIGGPALIVAGVLTGASVAPDRQPGATIETPQNAIEQGDENWPDPTKTSAPGETTLAPAVTTPPDGVPTTITPVVTGQPALTTTTTRSTSRSTSKSTTRTTRTTPPRTTRTTTTTTTTTETPTPTTTTDEPPPADV